MKFSLYLVFFLFFTTILCGQSFKNEDLVYDENIHSVELHRVGDKLSSPFLRLGSTDRLRLAFDDMSKETFLFRYTFVHCDHEWNESDLEPYEYLEGFLEDEILKYEFSRNAIPSYIHYDLTFPRRDMRFILSGNYILKVYLNDPEEDCIFTRRFFVIEPMVNIEATIPYYPRVLEYTRRKQQIDLTLNTPDLFSAEPMKRINVTIQQNGRWDNAKVGLKPTSVSTTRLDYIYPNGIVFDGGNSFRHFNMESFWYKSMYIRDIISEADGYSVILHTNSPRANREFETLIDLNGRRVIKARKEQDTNTEGEYAWVHFYLKAPRYDNADIYILGQLNDWQLNDRNKMVYDSQQRLYYGKMYLKQGYYDFMYGVKPRDKTKADVTLIEGDFWQADNEYTFYVYYREIVPEYDRLVGFMNVEALDIKR